MGMVERVEVLAVGFRHLAGDAPTAAELAAIAAAVADADAGRILPKLALGELLGGLNEDWPQPTREAALVECGLERALAPGVRERRVREAAAAQQAAEPEPYCGCGATKASECCAAVEGYFTTIRQRSGEELASLAEDGCGAAREVLKVVAG
jgi:hypothetical protein